MYIFQNAFRNVLRNRNRNILIGLIIFVIIVSTVVALMINNTAGSIIEDYKSRFGAEVKITPNMTRVREEAMQNSTDGKVKITQPVIPLEQYISFGESEHLQSSVYTASAGINCDDITSVEAELGPGSNMRMMGGGGMSGSEPTQFYMNLLGNRFDEFSDGTREISEGRMPENKNECIVSTDLAELNKLKMGDSFHFTSVLRDDEMNEHKISYDLKIVGTYYDITDEYGEGAMENSFTNRRNEVLTTYDTVIAPMIDDMRGIRVEAAYYLKNPDLLDAFAAEVYDKGLDEVFDVATDEASYDKIVGPVEGLKSISITFMIIVLIFGGVIIALLASIAIRERKYEIGVLRAMGMKKRKVALGLWSEMVILTCLCLILGLGVGTLTAQPVTNALLENQIKAAEEAAEEEEETRGMSGGMMMMGAGNLADSADSTAEPLSEIDISLSLNTALQIIGIALLLASFAAFISIIRITKYEPIKILMERN